MPRSCSEMTRERRASRALPPALRIMCASPRGMPYARAGSMRASMQVTVVVREERRIALGREREETYRRRISWRVGARDGRL